MFWVTFKSERQIARAADTIGSERASERRTASPGSFRRCGAHPERTRHEPCDGRRKRRAHTTSGPSRGPTSSSGRDLQQQPQHSVVPNEPQGLEHRHALSEPVGWRVAARNAGCCTVSINHRPRARPRAPIFPGDGLGPVFSAMNFGTGTSSDRCVSGK